jgi:hypothetical protein
VFATTWKDEVSKALPPPSWAGGAPGDITAADIPSAKRESTLVVRNPWAAL